MKRLFLVALGGALGSMARYLTASGVNRALGQGFPYGTLAVNVIGSFAIGAVAAKVTSSDVRLFLMTGIMGGFTTYSAFNEETLTALRAGLPIVALLNVGLTLLLCLAAGIAGAALAR